MARRSSTAKDIAAIEAEISKLMGDLESRVGKLNTLTRRGASHAVSEASDFLSETVSEAMTKLREGASYAGGRISDGVSDAGGRVRKNAYALTGGASSYGSSALTQIRTEAGNRPLLTLAIVAGLGFVIGMAGRRQ